MTTTIAIEPLTRAAFRPFGDVVDADQMERIGINQGFCERCNGLAAIDVSAEGGTVNVSLFHARPRPEPIAVALMEKHPLGSQMFVPMQDRPWLVLVCRDPDDPSTYRAFRATGRQGVNYAPDAWHHPLLVLDDPSVFLVVDRAGPGNNLVEHWLDDGERLNLVP